MSAPGRTTEPGASENLQGTYCDAFVRSRRSCKRPFWAVKTLLCPWSRVAAFSVTILCYSKLWHIYIFLVNGDRLGGMYHPHPQSLVHSTSLITSAELNVFFFFLFCYLVGSAGAEL